MSGRGVLCPLGLWWFVFGGEDVCVFYDDGRTPQDSTITIHWLYVSHGESVIELGAVAVKTVLLLWSRNGTGGRGRHV